MSKITIPKNAKVSVYFENAYVNEDGTECNVLLNNFEIVADSFSTKVQYNRESAYGRSSKPTGIVFIANGSDFNLQDKIENVEFTAEAGYNELGSITLKAFPLENIDEMREDILRKTGKNSAIEINSHSKMPVS